MWLSCDQQQEDEKSDAEEQAATNVGNFELVDGTQVLDSCASSLSFEDFPLPSPVSSSFSIVHGFCFCTDIKQGIQSTVEDSIQQIIFIDYMFEPGSLYFCWLLLALMLALSGICLICPVVVEWMVQSLFISLNLWLMWCALVILVSFLCQVPELSHVHGDLEWYQNDSPALVWGRARPPPLGNEEVCSLFVFSPR
jgi:hypothetical protein